MVVESLWIWKRLGAIDPLALVERGSVWGRGPLRRRTRGRGKVISGRRARGRHDGTDQRNEAVYLGDLCLGAERGRQGLALSWLFLVITITCFITTLAKPRHCTACCVHRPVRSSTTLASPLAQQISRYWPKMNTLRFALLAHSYYHSF